MKLNREPLQELSESLLREDHDYWLRYTGQLIGSWFTAETSMKEIRDFARRVYLQKDLSTFTGEPAFARNEAARRGFSKLRSSIAAVYAWRAEHDATPEARGRMAKEADFAFRQALALCPDSPETVFRYANFLHREKRREDALLVAETALLMEPSNAEVKGLREQLKQGP